MRTIWKYLLNPADGGRATHNMPVGAKIVNVGPDPMSIDWVAIWVEFDDGDAVEIATEPRTFQIVGTGHRIRAGRLVGSSINPPFAWHVFEETT